MTQRRITMMKTKVYFAPAMSVVAFDFEAQDILTLSQGSMKQELTMSFDELLNSGSNN